MHQYLKSIGFGNIRDKKQLIQIIRDVEESYTGHQLVTQDEVTDLCEFDKEYGEGIGIKVCGDMDIDEQFDYRYYAPYFTGSGVTSYANVSVERRIDREAYVGICEDTKVGINLVFYLQNMMEYLRERQIGGRSIKYSSVTLSGLCNEGTILLPGYPLHYPYFTLLPSYPTHHNNLSSLPLSPTPTPYNPFHHIIHNPTLHLHTSS